MALHIISPEADKLARKLAKQNGESITDAVINALKERLARTDAKKVGDREKRKAEIRDILKRMDTYPVLDNRTPDEILGYDQNGLPS
ncbi:MAG TPA: type II toxin-antitoxin system VapB family antitoxin [Rhizomicrobium sp.]|jgi:antitoxin VapB|nr:type II toxin-antitoxin system VapB family antitoxin [Rhizomicrobium sp.]